MPPLGLEQALLLKNMREKNSSTENVNDNTNNPRRRNGHVSQHENGVDENDTENDDDINKFTNGVLKSSVDSLKKSGIICKSIDTIHKLDNDSRMSIISSPIPEETTAQLKITNSEGDLRAATEPPKRERRWTAYEKLSHDLSNDPRCLKEITLGKRIGFYRIRGEIGTGNFSQVKMGVHTLTKEKVAIKILNKTRLDAKTQRLLSREITSMERLHHPNVIRLFEVVETLTKLHIIMEYAPGGELFTKISNEGKLQENDANVIYSQVVSAIQHIHSKNIVHRDLKAENVFYAGNNYVKVGDFGFSTIARPEQTLLTFCGSPPYAAPELFRDESYQGVYVDIWAMGILLHFMVTGVMPFRAETVGKLKKCILDGSFNIPPFVSDNCRFLLRNILKSLPRDRFTLSEICRSEWMAGVQFPDSLVPFENVGETEQTHEDTNETRKILSDLGITDDHLRRNPIRDSRSNITGTYRIVIHKVQKKESMASDEGAVVPERDIVEKASLTSNKKSRLCTIL